MTAIFPLVNHEPYRVPVGKATGGFTYPLVYTIQNTERSSIVGFGGMPVILLLRNANGGGTAFGAGTAQVETTFQGIDAVTDYSSPADYLFDTTGIDDGDVLAVEISGPPGQYWRVLNSTGGVLKVEYFYKPPRT